MKHHDDFDFPSSYGFTTVERAITRLYLHFLADECLDHFSKNNNDDQQFTGFLQLLAHAVPQTDPVAYIQQGRILQPLFLIGKKY